MKQLVVKMKDGQEWRIEADPSVAALAWGHGMRKRKPLSVTHRDGDEKDVILLLNPFEIVSILPREPS